MTEQQISGNFGDYLQALAYRVLHEDGVLQPRRASLFESEPAQIENYEETTQFPVADLIRPQLPAPPAVAPVESRRSLPAPITPAAPVPAATAAAPRTQAAHRDEPRAERRVPPTLHSVINTAAPVPAIPQTPQTRPTSHTEAPAQLATETLAQRLAIESPSSHPAPAAISHANFERPRPAPDRHDPSTPQPRAPLNATQPTREPAQIIHRRERLTPPLPQRLADSPRQAIMIARPAAAGHYIGPLLIPTPRPPREEAAVEITIGRLEIRALAAPPVSQQKPQPRRPEESLKDYLRRKSGGQA